MATLGELVGALVNSLSHARRLADEETVAIAEHYRNHPLLAGMSVPRVRIPEMRLDLPILLDDYGAGDGLRLAAAPVVRDAALAAVDAARDDGGVAVSDDVRADIAERIPEALDMLSARLEREQRAPDADEVGQTVARQIELALAEDFLRRQRIEPVEHEEPAEQVEPIEQAAPAERVEPAADDLEPGAREDEVELPDIGGDAVEPDGGEGGGGDDHDLRDPIGPVGQPGYDDMMDDVRQRVSAVALEPEGAPVDMPATVVTSSVKERLGDLDRLATRLHITLREEGMEWAVSEADGEPRAHLVPE